MKRQLWLWLAGLARLVLAGPGGTFSAYYKNKLNTFEFLMPHIVPNAADNHLCMQVLVQDNFYIVGFEPRAAAEVVHQMTLYGCRRPGSERVVWGCSALPGAAVTPRTAHTSPCLEGSQVLFGCAHNASGLRLPRHVGFQVGPDSPVTHLVLQVHYLRRYRGSTLVEVDNTGVILTFTRKRMSRLAGVVALSAGGALAARAETRLEACCALRENKTAHPFAFRVHTHKLGSVASCYAVRQGAAGDAWRALGKARPARAAGFLRVRDAAPLRPGDLLAARCTLRNPTSYAVAVGNKEWDEVCFVYVMYWVAAPASGDAAVGAGAGGDAAGGPLALKYCVSAGPPAYSWRTAIHGFRNIPDLQASLL